MSDIRRGHYRANYSLTAIQRVGERRGWQATGISRMDPLVREGSSGTTNNDVADLQKLIRFVERWRIAHFQRADASPVDARLLNADALLRKLHSGLQVALEGKSSLTGARPNYFAI